MAANDLVLAELMERLNVALTGKSVEWVRDHFAFRRTVEEFFFGDSIYYLADGGYSRVVWYDNGGNGGGELVLTSESLDKPKARWTDSDVVDLRNQIEKIMREWIRAASADCST